MQQLNSESVARYYAGSDVGSSNYKGMCAAVLADSHASVDCRACSGKGYRELSPEELRKWSNQIAAQKTTEHRDQVRRSLSRASDCAICRGSGKVSARRGDHAAAMDSMWTTVRCGLCRGCGETTAPTDTSAERQDVCLNCGGAAYIVPVTVRSKGSTNEGGSGGSSATDYDAGPLMLAGPADPTADADHDLSERRQVAAELRRLETQDPQLAAALASYHGPEGERWIRHRWGRGFVVWQHTRAGKQLAEHVAAQSLRGCGYLVAPTERLARARDTQERPPAGRTTADHQLQRVLLGKADREARELLRRLLATTSAAETAA
jgi:hypothetical protein